MTRTISKNIFIRLAAEANEADLCGDIKTADNVTKQIQKYASNKVRPDDAEYSYSKDELMEELEEILWDAAVRVLDYYDQTVDTKQIQEIVEFESKNFVESIENFIHKDIGPNEPKVIGEDEEKNDDREVHEDLFDNQDEAEDEYEEDADTDEDEDDKE